MVARWLENVKTEIQSKKGRKWDRSQHMRGCLGLNFISFKLLIFKTGEWIRHILLKFTISTISSSSSISSSISSSSLDKYLTKESSSFFFPQSAGRSTASAFLYVVVVVVVVVVVELARAFAPLSWISAGSSGRDSSFWSAMVVAASVACVGALTITTGAGVITSTSSTFCSGFQ